MELFTELKKIDPSSIGDVSKFWFRKKKSPALWCILPIFGIFGFSTLRGEGYLSQNFRFLCFLTCLFLENGGSEPFYRIEKSLSVSENGYHKVGVPLLAYLGKFRCCVVLYCVAVTLGKFRC